MTQAQHADPLAPRVTLAECGHGHSEPVNNGLLADVATLRGCLGKLALSLVVLIAADLVLATNDHRAIVLTGGERLAVPPCMKAIGA